MKMDREVALEALSSICNADVTSVQRAQSSFAQADFQPRAAPQARQTLLVKQLIPTILDADETSSVSNCTFNHIKGILCGAPRGFQPPLEDSAPRRDISHVIDEDEFFDPRFDYDFTSLKDTETYYRGGEVYERPCGWVRFALKVLDKYDGNKWLGTRYRSTQSVEGEWPVSYHGTSKKGADGIIHGYYKPGPGQTYGRGIYSTPYIAEAIQYAHTFTSKKTGKKYKVILQNRINPAYRKKYNNDKYWLIPIPKGTCENNEQEMVERAIHPYGLLLKEV